MPLRLGMSMRAKTNTFKQIKNKNIKKTHVYIYICRERENAFFCTLLDSCSEPLSPEALKP